MTSQPHESYSTPRSLEVRRHGATLALVLEFDDRDPAIAVLEPRDAHMLAGRLRKGANDAAAAAARRGAE